MKTLPFLKVSGSHFSCGQQVGLAFKNQIYRYLNLCRNDPPKDRSWQDCLDQTQKFITPTQKYFPDIVDEIKGAAKSADLDFIELFATSIEEFYSRHYHLKDCTDIILLPPASSHTLILHNNDLPPNLFETLTSVEWNFDDGSRMFTVGLAGIFVSVGVNNSQIVLSGNELTPNDTRIGIPRALIARAILSAKTFDEAVKIAIHPKRASSYNNIITTPNQSVSVEGSATNYELIFPQKGILTHSNHYCSPKMLSYEGKSDHHSSTERLNSADEITLSHLKPINFEMAKSFLGDHSPNENGNDNTICRHGKAKITLFGFAVDLDTGVVELASGNPCQNPFQKVWQIK